MFAYGQTAANAIAVMSFLAADMSRSAASGEIAEARNISRALTAKLLTQLAAAKLVIGQPGPGGGYRLARDPREISLMDIASVFENLDPPVARRGSSPPRFEPAIHDRNHSLHLRRAAEVTKMMARYMRSGPCFPN